MERFIFDTSSHTLVCGILNITPDSFSDGGKWDEPQKALEHALEMQALGADIIDVGAQSTRPGSTRLSADEENARLIPVLDLLKGRITVPISVDTFYPECARTALTHGAKIINDVSGEASDEMAKVVSEFGAGWIIMHNPAGADAVPVYENGVSDDVLDFFGRAARVAKSHGIPASSLCFDPGIGFAKSYEDNLRLIRDIGKIKTDGSALMSAASRKRVIGRDGRRKARPGNGGAAHGEHIERRRCYPRPRCILRRPVGARRGRTEKDIQGGRRWIR